MRGTTLNSILLAIAVVATGCTAGATAGPSTAAPTKSAAPSPPATVPASAPPSATAAITPVPASPSPAGSASITAPPIVLRRAPANLACDAIGVDYRRMTFRIDPAAAEQVSAITDTNVRLLTYWSAEFKAGSGPLRTIVDPAGKVVVTDGQVLEKPASGYPRLNGYFVCLGPSAIWVLFKDPQ